eukprot:1643269-Amphidinium_carterae.1
MMHLIHPPTKSPSAGRLRGGSLGIASKNDIANHHARASQKKSSPWFYTAKRNVRARLIPSPRKISHVIILRATAHKCEEMTTVMQEVWETQMQLHLKISRSRELPRDWEYVRLHHVPCNPQRRDYALSYMPEVNQCPHRRKQCPPPRRCCTNWLLCVPVLGVGVFRDIGLRLKLRDAFVPHRCPFTRIGIQKTLNVYVLLETSMLIFSARSCHSCSKTTHAKCCMAGFPYVSEHTQQFPFASQPLHHGLPRPFVEGSINDRPRQALSSTGGLKKFAHSLDVTSETHWSRLHARALVRAITCVIRTRGAPLRLSLDYS